MSENTPMTGMIPMVASNGPEIDILHWMGLSVMPTQFADGQPALRPVSLRHREFSFRGTIDLCSANDMDGIARVRELLATSRVLPAHLLDLKAQLERIVSTTPTTYVVPAFTRDEHGLAFLQEILSRATGSNDPHMDVITQDGGLGGAVVTRIYRDAICETSLGNALAASPALDRR